MSHLISKADAVIIKDIKNLGELMFQRFPAYYKYREYGIARNYLNYYGEAVKVGKWLWETDEGKQRLDYEADLWREQNRNKLCLQLVGDLHFRYVLAIGANQWIDTELLANINADKVLRTDITKDDGTEILADGCQMPFKDESFDMVICREVIEHVPDARALLLEVRRVLEPGGYFLLTTPNGYECPPDGIEHIRAFTPFTLLQALDVMGFKAIRKCGNLPGIFLMLLPLVRVGDENALLEFQQISEILKDFKDSYYIGSQLMVLAQI